MQSRVQNIRTVRYLLDLYDPTYRRRLKLMFFSTLLCYFSVVLYK